MAVTARTKMIVWTKAGGRCSSPDCRQQLIANARDGDSSLLGELAHIVAQRPDGPRGRKSPPGGDIDGPGNLVLLCPTHHTEVDSNEGKYTVERLVQIKCDHEQWVSDTLSPNERFQHSISPDTHVIDDVHSTLLPILGYPCYVYGASCDLSESEVRPLIEHPSRSSVMLPYIVRSRQLFTFCNLRARENPFRRAVDNGSVERHDSTDWWANDDLARWYADLLNRSLNKLTGRRDLRLDKEHRRYYFEPTEEGDDHEVQYRTLTGQKRSKKVAWRPTVRRTGEQKKYWEHLAVGLRFHRVADRSWVLSIRPERRFTRDGFQPLTPKGTGRRATSRKSRMYNEGVLREVNFWRDYLSRGRPRIKFGFGDQSLMIDTEILRTSIEWPGVPDDARPFTHLAYEEDLFTTIELDELADFEEADE
jgi:hypothetical protein